MSTPDLKTRLKAAGLTNVQAAEILGIPAPRVSEALHRYAGGPTWKAVAVLCAAWERLPKDDRAGLVDDLARLRAGLDPDHDAAPSPAARRSRRA